MKSNKLTYKEAVAMLPLRVRMIHTFSFVGPIMLGCDMSRATILKMIKDNGARINTDNKDAKTLDHNLVVVEDGRLLYIETRTNEK